MNYAFKMMAIVLSLCLFSNISNAIGFKLNCEINEFKKFKNKSKSKLLDLVNIHQTHEFIGRDVKLSKSNLFGELKYNGLGYGKKLEWIHYVDDLIIKYEYYAHKSKIGQGRLKIEASYRKKPFQEKKLLFDYNGTCFFQKIEKRVLAEAENKKNIIKEDRETKKFVGQERKYHKELENKEDYIPSKLPSWKGISETEPLRCYDTISKKVFIIPAEGVNTQARHKATTKCMGNAYRISKKDYEKLVPTQNIYESDKVICYNATDGWSGKWSTTNLKYVSKAIQLGLSCGIKTNPTIIAKNTNKGNIINSDEFKKEKQKRIELENKLAALEKKQKRIKSDNQEPTINAFAKQNGSKAIILGRVSDDTEVAEVLVDGQTQQLKPNGTFETDFYVPRSGKSIEIVAYDTKGNKASKFLKLERSNIQQTSGPTFDTLNPSVKKVKSNPNALALIIGISDYSKTKANAVYADKDAQQFYDYATMKLGIPARNVKELVNNKADRVEIGLAIQDWIARSTKQGKTDIYIYFAGHGLASQDGKDMFLLPYDGSPRLLKASAIRRKELFANIKLANPRSVTVFLDTCYSGVTRNEEMLIAGRPIVIKAKEQAIPDGFTLFSAASNEQISRPLEEAKHGMFSYFLMKGMEGDADANNDNKITARELHAYVEQNVVQQSSGSQTPELQGDKDRVLVQFNYGY